MIHISASTIKDFISCPRKVSFRIGGGSDVSVPSKEQLEGTIVHSVIENHGLNRDKANAALEKHILTYKNIDPKKVRRCLDNFFLLHSQTLSSTDLVEYYFKAPFNSKAVLTGKMDRIHNNVIFDWKTGEVPPEDINRDPQFILYYIAYKKLFSREPSGVVYADLYSKKSYLFKPDKDVLAEFQEEIIPGIIKAISSNNFPRYGFYGYRVCTKCSFKGVCWGNHDE